MWVGFFGWGTVRDECWCASGGFGAGVGHGYFDDFDLCLGCPKEGSCSTSFLPVDYVFYVAAIDLGVLWMVPGIQRIGDCLVVDIDS